MRKKSGQKKGRDRGESQPKEEEMKAYLFSLSKVPKCTEILNRVEDVFFNYRDRIFALFGPGDKMARSVKPCSYCDKLNPSWK